MDKLRQFLVLFCIVLMLVFNYLSNTAYFGGRTNADISNNYHTLITPAGYAFAIWGLIFLGVLAFGIYQVLPSQQTNPRFRAVGWWVVVNALCNAVWSPLFNNEKLGLSVLVILLMLVSLVFIEQGLLAKGPSQLIVADQNATLPEQTTTPAMTWLARVPFSLYFGWLTIATIVNITVYLKATDFSLLGLSEQNWAIVMLIVGLFIGAVVFNRFHSIAYILVFAWAYAAIAVEQAGYGPVQVVAGAGVIIAFVLIIAGLISKKVPAYS